MIWFSTRRQKQAELLECRRVRSTWLGWLASARLYSRTKSPSEPCRIRAAGGQPSLFLDSVANGATARSSSCRCHAMAQSQSQGTCGKRANLMSSCRFLAFRGCTGWLLSLSALPPKTLCVKLDLYGTRYVSMPSQTFL